MLNLRIKSSLQFLMLGWNTSFFLKKKKNTKKPTLSLESCETLAVTIVQFWN